MSTGRKIDYFGQLGVSESASPDEIKQAYRRLARQYHPDLNSDPQAVEQFREITQAYRILSDPHTRSQYILERLETRRAAPNVWRQKKSQRKLYQTFLVTGVLLFALGFLMISLDRIWFNIYPAYSAKPTTCLVVRWQEFSQDHYRLHYLAIVPWQTEPFLSWRDYKAVKRELPPQTVFTCYYNSQYHATHLTRVDAAAILPHIPMLMMGLVLGAGSFYGTYHLLTH